MPETFETQWATETGGNASGPALALRTGPGASTARSARYAVRRRSVRHFEGLITDSSELGHLLWKHDRDCGAVVFDAVDRQFKVLCVDIGQALPQVVKADVRMLVV